MAKAKVLVDRDEFMSQMIKCIGSEEWGKSVQGQTQERTNCGNGWHWFCW